MKAYATGMSGIALAMTAIICHAENNSAFNMPTSWQMRVLPNTPFSAPLPTEAIIDGSGVKYDVKNHETNFSFALFEKENWNGSFEEYKARINSHFDPHASTPFSDSYDGLKFCQPIDAINNGEIGVIEIYPVCGVKCLQHHILFNGIIYKFRDGCDLSDEARRMESTALMNVRLAYSPASAIQYLLDHGIASGYPDGSFKPERTINRAEFTKIVVGAVYDAAKINECPALSSVSPFPDVSADDWFLPYTCTARRFGIMDGYPDGTFGPAREINTAEAAKIVAGAFGISTTTETQEGAAWPANRSPEGEGWYQPYMDALNALEALPASAQDPTHLLTRGEMAEVIYKIMNRYN